MKLFLITLSIFSATLTVQAGASPGAYDKLRRMFDSANGSLKVADVHAMAAKVKDCASSSASSPNEITKAAKVVSVTYTSDSFGPDFPAATYTGLGLNSTTDQIRTVYEGFFSNYKETLAPNELQLNTTYWYTGSSCYKDTDGTRTCDDVTKSNLVEVVIRLTPKYLLYKSGEDYAYCWQ